MFTPKYKEEDVVGKIGICVWHRLWLVGLKYLWGYFGKILDINQCESYSHHQILLR
jgi:hypothetical protein